MHNSPISWNLILYYNFLNIIIPGTQKSIAAGFRKILYYSWKVDTSCPFTLDFDLWPVFSKHNPGPLHADIVHNFLDGCVCFGPCACMFVYMPLFVCTCLYVCMYVSTSMYVCMTLYAWINSYSAKKQMYWSNGDSVIWNLGHWGCVYSSAMSISLGSRAIDIRLVILV